MNDAPAIQKELQCANCGGQCLYDPAQQALVCQSCGAPTQLETPNDGAAAEEFPYNPARDVGDPLIRSPRQVHHCETCGGDVIFVGQALSERCAYCDGPIVLAQSDTAYQTMALIPFRVPEADAQAFVQRWVGNRFAAPDDLAGIVSKARVAGIYVPFWTFDSDEAIDYWARYRVRRGKRTYSRSTRGQMRVRFNDMLVPASPHVTLLIRDGILHDFDPRRLRPYRAGYLSGFAAEQHHQTVAEGLAANAADKDVLIRNRIKRHINRQGVHNIGYNTDTTGIHYRRILLPVWILHYTYEGKAKKVVVCGMQGRTYGERPFSTKKLALYAALLSGLAIVTGALWGAAGML